MSLSLCLLYTADEGLDAPKLLLSTRLVTILSFEGDDMDVSVQMDDMQIFKHVKHGSAELCDRDVQTEEDLR